MDSNIVFLQLVVVIVNIILSAIFQHYFHSNAYATLLRRLVQLSETSRIDIGIAHQGASQEEGERAPLIRRERATSPIIDWTAGLPEEETKESKGSGSGGPNKGTEGKDTGSNSGLGKNEGDKETQEGGEGNRTKID